MLTHQEAFEIGHNWIDTWNRNCLTDYSHLYAEDAEEVSSLANRLIMASHGHLKGKKLLMDYWEILRSKLPNHHYALEDIQLYNGHVFVHFHIPALETKAIARIMLNRQNQIEKIRISHV